MVESPPSSGSALGFTIPLVRVVALEVADRLTVTGEEEIRRCLMTGEDFWFSSSCDGSFERPNLVRCFPRDLMNDVVVVVDRFSEATTGMFIVCDLLGVEDEAEVI